jgi:hypothetical protein
MSTADFAAQFVPELQSVGRSACMHIGAVEVYQQNKETVWLPIAQRRVTESS